jgi:serine/threonine protein kinase
MARFEIMAARQSPSAMPSFEHLHSVCQKMEGIIQACREDRSSEKKLLHMNMEQCQDLAFKLTQAFRKISDEKTQPGAVSEFCVAASKAESLVDVCMSEQWILNAVLSGEFAEHFVEVLLDLERATDVVQLGARSMSLQDFLNGQKKLKNSLRGLNVGMSIISRRKIDKKSLRAMICEEMKRPQHDPEYHSERCQLAQLYRHNRKPVSSPPPELVQKLLRSYKLHILSMDGVSCDNKGTSGVVVKLPWVYGKDFAVKMPRPGYVSPDDMPHLDGVPPVDMPALKFQKEAEIMAKYHNPYIVGLVGHWGIEPPSRWSAKGRVPFLMMEWMDLDLKKLMYLKKNPEVNLWQSVINFLPWSGTQRMDGFSPLEAIDLILPIARAMQYLHGMERNFHVAHRDLKPQNIICSLKRMDGNGILEGATIKLIDFGEAMENAKQVRDWRRAGTTEYTAPELFNKPEDPIDLLKTDVYSFGLVLGELLTWKSPMEALGCEDDPHAFKIHILKEERPALPEQPERCPLYLKFIVTSCWHPDPTIRPEFEDICLMLANAKLLLSGIYDREDPSMFVYRDSNFVRRRMALS